MGTEKKYLALGSVVKLKDTDKKIVIVSRKAVVDDFEYDYGGALYPEGMVDTNLVLFQMTDIEKIIFQGYSDEEEDEFFSAKSNEKTEVIEEDDDDLFAGLRDGWDD